jgi:hypothetical protein
MRMMGALLGVGLGASAWAADPTFQHQGRLLGPSGDPVAGTVSLMVSLYPSESATTAAWAGAFTPTLADGYYAVTLGPDPALTSAVGASDTLWVGVAVGGAELGPRSRLGAVPYAASGGGPGLVFDAAEVDFGASATGATRTLTLTNRSGVAATGLVIRGRGGFQRSGGTCGTTLAVGASCTVVVAHTSGFGAVEGTVVAASPTAGSGTALLTGAFASPLLGNAIDGDLNVTGTVDLTAQVAGSNRLAQADGIAYSVTSLSSTAADFGRTPAGFAVGDRAMLMLLQSSTTTDVGNYDLVAITSVTATGVVFDRSITTSRYDDGSNRVIVLQRVPQYNNVTIGASGVVTAGRWDRVTATASPAGVVRTGVVAFLATGVVTVDGKILADFLGYRGGVNNTADYNAGSPHGFYGEGVSTGFYGSRATWNTQPNDGGGGGGWSPGGCCHGNGGGGGGYGSGGGVGTIDGGGRTSSPTNGTQTTGGSSYGVADLTRLYLGGGGGGGGNHSGGGGACDANDSECNAGGRGGGIIFVRGRQIVNRGSVTALGEGGYPQLGTPACATRASVNTQDGGGGSGAGGSILLQATESITSTAGVLWAYGGPQGCLNGWPSSNHDSQRGGAGGNGRIRLEAPVVTGTATPAASVGTF